MSDPTEFIKAVLVKIREREKHILPGARSISITANSFRLVKDIRKAKSLKVNSYFSKEKTNEQSKSK